MPDGGAPCSPHTCLKTERSREQGSGEEWMGDKRGGEEEEEMGKQAGVPLFSSREFTSDL